MQTQLYDYFQQIEDRHWWFQARKEIVLYTIERFFKKENKVDILDIGCGTGMMLQALGAYGNVWGLDKSAKAIAYAKNKAPNARLVVGSFPDHLPKKRFDIVTALDILEHIEDDTHALEKLGDVMKPGGITIITVPAYQFLWTAHDTVNEHKRRYTKSELQKKIQHAGLRIKKISYYNTFLFVPIATAKLIKRLSHKQQSHFASTPPSALVNMPLRSIFSSEKYVLPYIDFPFGISIIAILSKK